MSTLNIVIFNAYLAIINLFSSRDIKTFNMFGGLNAPIRSRITNVNPNNLYGLVASNLRAIIALKLQPTPLFRKNGIDCVKGIHQQAIQLNNLSLNKIDP